MGFFGAMAPLGPILRNFRLRMRTSKGTPKGSGDLCSLRVTFHNVTSGQKSPLGRYCATSGCTCADTKGAPKGSRDLRLLRVTFHNVTSGEKANFSLKSNPIGAQTQDISHSRQAR